MNELNEKDLQIARISYLIGTMMGQISELLNQMHNNDLSKIDTYNSLLDIHKMASLQIHEIYYKKK